MNLLMEIMNKLVLFSTFNFINEFEVKFVLRIWMTERVDLCILGMSAGACKNYPLNGFMNHILHYREQSSIFIRLWVGLTSCISKACICGIGYMIFIIEFIWFAYHIFNWLYTWLPAVYLLGVHKKAIDKER